MEAKLFGRSHPYAVLKPDPSGDLPIPLHALDINIPSGSPINDRQERNKVATQAQNMMIDVSNYTNSLSPNLFRNVEANEGTLIHNGIQFTIGEPITMTTHIQGVLHTEDGSKEISGMVSPTDSHHIHLSVIKRDINGQITSMRNIDVRYKGFFTIEEIDTTEPHPTRRVNLFRKRNSNILHKVPAVGRPKVRTNTLKLIDEVNSDIRQLFAA